MRSPYRCGLGRVLLCALPALLPAQEQEPAPVDIPMLARTLRRADLPSGDQGAVAEQLLAAGDRGAVALLEALELEAKAGEQVFRAEAGRLQSVFERRARAELGRRKGKDGDRRIGTLRYEVLQRTRGEGLSKEVIVGEIDPRVAELRTLLTIDVDAVLAATPSLLAQVERARAAAARLGRLYELRVQADASLQATAAGRTLLERHRSFADPRALGATLDAELAVLAAQATPMSQRDARTLVANEALVDGVEAEEKAGVRELNRVRILLGLSALLLDPKLCSAARDHSTAMVKLGFFSHTSPVAGKETFGARAAEASTSASAENIAYGQSTGADAIRAWWYSPGHHGNMLGDAMRIGLGRHETHWTQLFGQ